MTTSEDLDARLPAALDYGGAREVANLTRFRIALRILDGVEPRGPDETKAMTDLHSRLVAFIAAAERGLSG